jgi:hypothetical protein
VLGCGRWQEVERPKALLDWFFHTATTAKYQIKGETPSTFSNLHASCPGSCLLSCAEPRRRMAGLGRSSKSHVDKLRLYHLNQGFRPYIGRWPVKTMGLEARRLEGEITEQ